MPCMGLGLEPLTVQYIISNLFIIASPLAIAEQKSPKSTRYLSSCSPIEMLDQCGGHAEKRRDHAIQAAGDMWAI